jgi:hypothetical protein
MEVERTVEQQSGNGVRMTPTREPRANGAYGQGLRGYARALFVFGTLAMAGCSAYRTPLPTVPGAAAAAPAAAPCNLWSFLLPTAQQRQSLCNCICGSTLGQMANSMLKPVSLFSGGMIPGICPGPNSANPADLAKPADSAEGAAARIKQSEADAAARRAAVRYLGTVDCKRFPEAEAAIVNSLLTDTNECVRLEAALALGRGCCCTEVTVRALMQVVSGQAGNDPPETSERVRCAAAIALDRCLARCADALCGTPVRPESPVPPEQPPKMQAPAEPIPAPQPTPASPPASGPLLHQARRVLDEFRAKHHGQLTPLPIVDSEPSVLTADRRNQNPGSLADQIRAAGGNGPQPQDVQPHEAQPPEAPSREAPLRDKQILPGVTMPSRSHLQNTK